MNTGQNSNDPTVAAAIAEIERLLESDPAAARDRAAALLRERPGEPVALLYQAIALRVLQKPEEAAEILAALCRDWPDAPFAHLQHGLALRELDNPGAAERSFERAVEARPDFADGWLALADLRVANGDAAGADQAFARYVEVAPQVPELRNAAAALGSGNSAAAEPLVRQRLRAHPNDIVALCLLADIAERHDQNADAWHLLRRVIQIAPGYTRARHNYAVVLLRRNETDEALAECERLLQRAPQDQELRKLKAAILVKLLEYERSIGICEELLQEDPGQPAVLTSLGHMLKSVGRSADSIAAYRKAIALEPSRGEAYWSLANLKTNEIRDEEIEAMRSQLETPAVGDIDRTHFHFALGKALEERQRYEESFRHYDQGNRLRQRVRPYDPALLAEHVRRSKSLFSRSFFESRHGSGAPLPDPIFVVGLPRSGSTLVEQILASHSSVEGTMELPDVAAIAASLDRDDGRGGSLYPDVLETLQPDRLAELGQSYLERTRGHRKLGTPSFVDKMPNNFAHSGLIHLMLPNARIVDVRRHPLACGWSVYKELFAGSQNFSYSLEHIGLYYRCYLELMRHMDAVLPGRVHRVIYEDLVENTEAEVRRLLDYCDLPFEAGCLRFHENRRAVSTASAEQVRQPINRRGIDQWRHFGASLSPLEETLGDAVETYRSVSPD
ncbi:MAG: sulfotransferase [Pseudomonadota bacterium]